MTVLLPSIRQRSRFLFDWDAAACLAAPEQALDANTSQVATFSRASIKTALDANLAVRTVAHSLPAFQWATDPVSGLKVPGVLLEAAATNLLLRSQDMSNAAWSKTNVTATANQATAPDGTLTATKVAATASAATVCAQAVVATATSHVYSIYVKIGSGALDACSFAIYNNTTATNLASATINYTTGVLTVTIGNGYVLALANGWYRVVLYASAGIAIGNNIQGYVGFAGSPETAGEYCYAWGAQLESGITATSYIATVAATVTRSADSLSMPINIVPQALTLYAKYRFRPSNGSIPADIMYLINAGGTGASIVLRAENSSVWLRCLHTETAGSSDVSLSSGAPTVDDTVELRAVISSTGAAQINASINGAAEQSSSAGSAVAFDSAFGTGAKIYLGRWAGATDYGCPILKARIAPGSQTLAFMQAG